MEGEKFVDLSCKALLSRIPSAGPKMRIKSSFASLSKSAPSQDHQNKEIDLYSIILSYGKFKVINKHLPPSTLV